MIGRKLVAVCLALALALELDIGEASAQPVDWPVADRGDACYQQNSFPIASYGEIALSRPESIFTERWQFGKAEPLGSYAKADSLRTQAAPVVRLDVVMSSGCMQTCTATLLPGGIIITARHCFRTSTADARRAQVVFDHYLSSDTSLPTVEVDLQNVRTFEEVINEQGVEVTPDVAVAHLTSVPDWPTAILHPFLPASGASLELIHHPGGQAKHITRGGCRVVSNDGVAIMHRCDTVGGSSGAPMFDEASRRIVGIHVRGTTNTSTETANMGYSVAALAPQLRAIYAEALFASPTETLIAANASLGTPVVELPLQDSTEQISPQLGTAIADFEAQRYRSALGPLLMLGGGGDATAQLYLGDMYAKGLEVIRDEASGVDWYRKSAEQGNTQAMLRLGNAYLSGIGATRDHAQAFEWFSRAAQDGVPKAMFMVGAMYSNGFGVEASQDQMLEWLRRAAALDDLDAIRMLRFALGWRFEDPAAQAEAAEMLRRGAALGDLAMMVQLGERYATGDEYIPKDTERALELLRTGEARSSPSAFLYLGNMYRDGNGVPRNLALAEAYFRTSAEAGDRGGLENLIALLEGKPDADREEVFELYRRALREESQDTSAIGYLGLAGFYQRGEIVPRDPARALLYSVRGIDFWFWYGRNLEREWNVFRAARSDVDEVDEAEVLDELCEVPGRNSLVDCTGDQPTWRAIADSSSPPVFVPDTRPMVSSTTIRVD